MRNSRLLIAVSLACIALLGELLIARQAYVARHGPWDRWQPPAIALPSPNGFDTYLKAFAFKREIDKAHSLPEPYPKGGSDADRTRWLKNPWPEGPRDLPLAQRVGLYADVLHLTREALKQECRVPPPDNDAKGETGDYLSLLGPFRQIARLLWMESVDRRERGDYAGAVASAMDCIQMARDAATQRTTPSLGTAEGVESYGWLALDDVLPRLNASQCRAILARVQALERSRLPLTEFIDGEERHARPLFRQIVAKPSELVNWFSTSMQKDIYGDTPVDVGNTDFRASWQALGDRYAKLREAAAWPYAEQRGLAEPTDPVVIFLTTAAGLPLRFSDARSRALSRLRMARLASRGYLLERGHLPGTLADLVPGYMSEVPADPFGTGPLKSGATGGVLVIYSVGPDCVDDGGRALNGTFGWDSKGDIVVTLAAKE